MSLTSQETNQRIQMLNQHFAEVISAHVVTIRRSILRRRGEFTTCTIPRRVLCWRSVCVGLFLISLSSGAEELSGKVVRILDGDTVEVVTLPANVLVYEAPTRIRLNGIDAPEKKQAYGQRSKQYLADLIGGKRVTISFTKHDRYLRVLGDIVLKECKPECYTLDVNAAMVNAGMAWSYRYHNEATSPKMASLEATARSSKQGLWHDSNPVEPWKWRREHH